MLVIKQVVKNVIIADKKRKHATGSNEIPSNLDIEA